MDKAFLKSSFINNIVCAEAILINIQNICFPKEYHGTVNDKIHDTLIFVQIGLTLLRILL